MSRRLPLAPPAFEVKEWEDEEEEEPGPARLGKKVPIPPLLDSRMVLQPGPPSMTSSLVSTGPDAVCVTTVRMLLVQEEEELVNMSVPGPLISVMPLLPVPGKEEVEVEVEEDVPGTLDTVAGEVKDPSVSRISFMVWTCRTTYDYYL